MDQIFIIFFPINTSYINLFIKNKYDFIGIWWYNLHIYFNKRFLESFINRNRKLFRN